MRPSFTIFTKYAPISFVLCLLLALFCANIQAQTCDRVGWVSSVEPGCGAKIVDLDNGNIILAVSGAENLLGGKTFSFAATAAPPPIGSCGITGLETVNLSCVSEILPCTVDFLVERSKFDIMSRGFKAAVYDGNVQKCSWTFSDGATATGKEVYHVFPYEGVFTVTLTVQDPWGCSLVESKNIYISGISEACQYTIEVTAVNKELFASIANTSPDEHVLSNIKWYFKKSGQILSTNAAFSMQLPSYGNYLVCADYTSSKADDGQICDATMCQQIIVSEPDCKRPFNNPTNISICAPAFVPVCSCEGITYNNECEAMQAGVTGWWAGTCATVSGICAADVAIGGISGSPAIGYTVEFNNQTFGDFEKIQLDFGDGSPLFESSNWTSTSHYYSNGGIYRVNLEAWKDGACVSSVTRLLTTDAYSHQFKNLPTGTDYVMPGDANGDRKANMYDLLNLGVGFYHEGAPRPNAHSAWSPQFAPNWSEKVGGVVNFKHLDCDGNGSINVFDTDPLEQHYAALKVTNQDSEPGLPKVWVQYNNNLDTITINPQIPAVVTLNADIMLGTPQQPALGIYGLAFALQYPEPVEHNPNVDYDDNSFLGPVNHILTLNRDFHDKRQLDLGIVRTNGIKTGGYGRVASVAMELDFIIIVDIIERNSSNIIPLTSVVSNIKAVDEKGNEIKLSVPVTLDTIWLNVLDLTSSNKSVLSDKATVFPNPATDQTAVIVPQGMVVESIEVYDALGKITHTIAGVSNRVQRLQTDQWAAGVHTLKIRTSEGIIEKRVCVIK